MTAFGKKQRRFSVALYRYPWLEYSIIKDAVFCQACRFFGDGKSKFEGSSGVRDWKGLIERASVHNDGYPHKRAFERLQIAKAMAIQGDVRTQVAASEDISSVERNRAHLKVVLDVLLLCARQGLPLRGHDEGEDSNNEGNFLAVFKLLSTTTTCGGGSMNSRRTQSFCHR
jgi:hypothetical protein